jgi:hypothetical protein
MFVFVPFAFNIYCLLSSYCTISHYFVSHSTTPHHITHHTLHIAHCTSHCTSHCTTSCCIASCHITSHHISSLLCRLSMALFRTNLHPSSSLCYIFQDLFGGFVRVLEPSIINATSLVTTSRVTLTNGFATTQHQQSLLPPHSCTTSPQPQLQL